MIDENQLIAVTPNVDYKNLAAQPSPEDWFLISRVAGQLSLKELCAVSGLGKDKTVTAVVRLLELGLLQKVGADGKPVGGGPTPANAAPQPQAQKPAAAPRPSPQPADRSQPVGRTAPPSDDLFGGGASAVPGDDDDDLFMPDSPVHVSRVAEDASAPPQRPRQEQSAQQRPQQQAKPRPEPAAKPQPEPAAPAPDKGADERAKRAAEPRSTAPTDPYAKFPTPLASWELPSELVEDGIERETLTEIHYVYAHLERIDFYQLFGIPMDANRKDIRSAYFAMSKRFHPDKFFRGSAPVAAERVEAIFKFVTKGYDTLSKKGKREEYDRALQQLRSQEEVVSREEDRKRAMAADMLQRRAEQLEEQGDLIRASAEFRKVATLRRDPAALVKAAQLMLRANQSLDEAAQLARAAATEKPDEPEAHLVLGQIYEKNDMLVEALAAFEEALQLEPSDPSIQIHVERVRSQLR